jgi:hypothetical protein
VDECHACLAADPEGGIGAGDANRSRKFTGRHHRGHLRRALDRLLDGFEPLLDGGGDRWFGRLPLQFRHRVGRAERERARLVHPLPQRRQLAILRIEPCGLAMRARRSASSVRSSSTATFAVDDVTAAGPRGVSVCAAADPERHSHTANTARLLPEGTMRPPDEIFVNWSASTSSASIELLRFGLLKSGPISARLSRRRR